MDQQNLVATELGVLVQASEILNQAAQDITIENRIEKLIEVNQIVREEQETVNLIDRIRNTAGEIKLHFAQKELPNLAGEIQFTSEDFLVLKQAKTQYLIALKQVEIISGVDDKAILRNLSQELNTPLLWLKNLVDAQNSVTVQLLSGRTLSGKINRLSCDHLDLSSSTQISLVPLNSIVFLRCDYEAS